LKEAVLTVETDIATETRPRRTMLGLGTVALPGAAVLLHAGRATTEHTPSTTAEGIVTDRVAPVIETTTADPASPTRTSTGRLRADPSSTTTGSTEPATGIVIGAERGTDAVMSAIDIVSAAAPRTPHAPATAETNLSRRVIMTDGTRDRGTVDTTIT
jgi:hypothetical protein